MRWWQEGQCPPTHDQALARLPPGKGIRDQRAMSCYAKPASADSEGKGRGGKEGRKQASNKDRAMVVCANSRLSSGLVIAPQRPTALPGPLHTILAPTLPTKLAFLPCANQRPSQDMFSTHESWASAAGGKTALLPSRKCQFKAPLRQPQVKVKESSSTQGHSPAPARAPNDRCAECQDPHNALTIAWPWPLPSSPSRLEQWPPA